MSAKQENDIYNSGPCAELTGLATTPGSSDGWYYFDLDRMRAMMMFARGHTDIETVRNISRNALLNGDITFARYKNKSKSNKKESSSSTENDEDDEFSGEDDFVVRQRSDMWKKWVHELLDLDEEIELAPTTFVRNTTHTAILDTDPWRPTFVNMSKVTCMRGRDDIVSGTTEYELYTCGTPESSLRPEHLIPNVHVVTRRGHVMGPGGPLVLSRVSKVRQHYRLYENKVEAEINADTKRSFDPPVVVVDTNTDRTGGKNGPNPHDPQRTNAGEFADGPDAQVAAPVASRMTEADLAVGERIAAGNGYGSASHLEYKKRIKEINTAVVRKLPPNSVLASGYQAPDPPTDTLPSGEMALGKTCQLWGLPKNLLSTGDSTGTPKLNEAAGGSSAMSRIFEDAQAATKSWIETEIENMHYRMYAHDHAARIAMRDEVKEDEEKEPASVAHARSNGKKGGVKRPKPDDDMYEQDDLQSEQKSRRLLDEFDRKTRVVVSLPGNMSLADLLLLYDKKMIKWEAMRPKLARYAQTAMDDFFDEDPPTEQDNAISLTEAKPAAAAGASASGGGSSKSGGKKPASASASKKKK